MRAKIAAGNWKMNGTRSALTELEAIASGLVPEGPVVLLCPPAPLLYRACRAADDTPLKIGAQDCHTQESGAFTGDISAPMVADTGATHVILGHSERRDYHGETDAQVRAKMTSAWASGLIAILCVGETEGEREASNTLEIIAGQLAGSLPDGVTANNTVVAYEPIWAIGTGKVPKLEEIVEVHDFLRARLVRRFGEEVGDAIPLLYGGSVKPDNAATIFRAENVDGALVGGASLKAADFLPIVAALADS
ncbi:MAG: triose-phosphate isomerase [Sulfitobacter sp.]|nr:triose-phosphate isomerase [Sulfitobacter sp.]